MATDPPTLFDVGPALPDGFVYREEFITAPDEARLVEAIQRLSFSEVRMHGVVARRRIVQFGWRYSFDSAAVSPGADLPDFLAPLRERAASLIDREPDDLSETLVTEYAPGATIGWHRDAPPFGIVVGISLLSSCRFRLRREAAGQRELIVVNVQPRSAYVLSGRVRSAWQHSISPTRSLRYSITFRTLRSQDRERLRT